MGLSSGQWFYPLGRFLNFLMKNDDKIISLLKKGHDRESRVMILPSGFVVTQQKLRDPNGAIIYPVGIDTASKIKRTGCLT